MDLQKFRQEFPSLYQDWGLASCQPKSEQLIAIFRQITDETSEIDSTNIMQLLNFAVACMEAGEIYCHYRCSQGSELIAALINHTQAFSYVVEDLSSSSNVILDLLLLRLAQWQVDEQIFLYGDGLEKFCFELRENASEDQIGIFFYNATDDYRTQLLNLLLIKPFLAERSLIILRGSKLNSVRQLAWDFMATHPQCQLLMDLPLAKDGNTSFGNGLLILSWDEQSNYNYDWSSIQTARSQKNTNIYFVCPDNNLPSGGVKQLYRQVDILNQNGFSAFILHETLNFRCTWFENNTKIAYSPLTKLENSDYLVLPEGRYTRDVDKISPGIKKVIFNQNLYYAFDGHQIERDIVPISYRHREVVASIVVSEDNWAYFDYAFPNLNLFRIHYGFDPKIFSYNPHKKKQICFMPRKRLEDSIQVINILKFRNALNDFDIVPIIDKSEQETAEILRQSLIFLSFGYPESFSMPPVEAMACGCIVIGYHGMGGREYFKPEFSYPIEVGYITEFARTVEQVIREYYTNPNVLLAKGKQASEYILSHYSLEQEESDIVSVWRQILAKEHKYLHHATAIKDFSEFSGISIATLEANLLNRQALDQEAWEAIATLPTKNTSTANDWRSQCYIHNLLAHNYNLPSIVSKLNAVNPLILRLIKEHPGQNFLDFSGSLGLLSQIVWQFNKTATYLHTSELVLDFTTWRFHQHQLPMQVLRASSSYLELKDNYDVIFADAAIASMANPLQCVEQFCDHLKENGLLILLLDFAEYGAVDSTLQYFDVSNLHQAVKHNGLTNILGYNTPYSIWQNQIN